MGVEKCKYRAIDDYIDTELSTLIEKTTMCNWLTPNMATIFGIVLAYPLYYAIKKRNYILVFLLLICRAVIDSLDGNLAKTCKKTSQLGSYLDLLSDSLGVGIVLYFIFINYYKIEPDVRYLSIIIPGVFLLFNSGLNNATHAPNNKLMEIGRSNSILSTVCLFCVLIISWLPHRC